jgi:lysophospholipase L1-like esterase
MCPADITVPSSGGNPTQVIFPPVTSTGGTPPVTIVCSPQSGSIFPVGTSKVTCVATDAAHLSSNCSFAVTVQSVAVPHLALTRFVAFGDSITEGKLGDGTLLGSDSYPANLESMLKARYTTQAQSISVKNEGCSGETAQAGGTTCPPGGVVRLPGVLVADNPQALLLLEGANDLSGGDPAAISPMIDALRTMVRQAKSRGIVVFLSTLTPVRQNGTPPRGNGGFLLTAPANDQIRFLATSEGAILVDSYAGFGSSPDPYIGPDGLHPTLAGYQKLAQIFFGAIGTNLEGVAGLIP